MSVSFLYLTSEDFHLESVPKGDVMCHDIPGFSLILFYSTHCKFCKDLIPIFKRLPGALQGCQFGMINVGSNRECVEMSQSTIVPIQYVPFIMLYFNGKPHMVYKGDHDEGMIKKFIYNVATDMQMKQQFSSLKEAKIKENAASGVPEYTTTTGVPYCAGNVCYLDWVKAYGNTPNQAGGQRMPQR
jgi:hypothetical protein